MTKQITDDQTAGKLGAALPNLSTKGQTMTSPTKGSAVDHKILQEQRRFRELLGDSGIEIRHTLKHLPELLDHSKWAYTLLRATAIACDGGIAMFLGDRGTGKTQAAIELIRDTCNNGKSARYVRCREIGMKLREAYGKDGTVTEMAAVAHFVKPHLLVIDECQERMDTDFEARSFSLILDKRYGAMKPTVLIANCDQKAMREIIGASVCDRVKEGGGCLMFDWASFRKQK